MSELVLFDDGAVGLGPLCDLRASFELRSGAMTTAARLSRQTGLSVAGLAVKDALAALVAERFDGPVNRLPDGERFLLINGRCTAVSFDLPESGEAVVGPAGDLLAVELDRASAEAFLAEGMRMPAGLRRREVAATGLLTRPWELIAIAREHLPGDLDAIDLPRSSGDEPGVTVRGDHAVKVAADVTLKPPIVFDATGGPIIIESGAVIEPMTTLEGPCCVGPGSTVVRHADIRRNTIIGPACKVGGEVSGSILQGHANKSHFGFLGDSYLGEWVNLGAGTTTSNLKNTYGTVSMRDAAEMEAEATGMQFLGSIIGDHAKTAIGTRLATGTCVGTAAMLALSRFPPKYVDRFTFLTDAGAERYDLTRFLEVAARVMQRRGRSVSPALAARLKALHEG